MSEFDVDSISMISENEPDFGNEPKDVEAYFTNSEQSQSPASNVRNASICLTLNYTINSQVL